LERGQYAHTILPEANRLVTLKGFSMSVDIFISHAKEDADISAMIHDDLETAGLNAWLDLRDIQPSDDFSAEIHNALAAAPKVLLLLSPYSSASAYVRGEWEFALSNNKQLFVALVAKMEKAQIPPRLWTIQRVDLYENYDKGKSILIRALQSGQDKCGARSSNLFVTRSLKERDIVHGEPNTMQLQITNSGQFDAVKMQVSDELPEGVVIQSGTSRWQGDLLSKNTKEIEYTFTTSRVGNMIFPGLQISYRQNNVYKKEKASCVSYRVKNATPPKLKFDVTMNPAIARVDNYATVFYRLINAGGTPAENLRLKLVVSDPDTEVDAKRKLPSSICLRRNESWTYQISIIARRHGNRELPQLTGTYKYHNNEHEFGTPSSSFIAELGWCNELIGRDFLNNQLKASYEKASSFQGQVVLITGEAGVGKSHMIASFLDQATKSGALCLPGHCGALHETIPFLPFKQIFETLLSLPKFAKKEERMAIAGVRLQDILPQVESHIPTLTTLIGGAHENQAEGTGREFRERFLFATLELFRALSNSQTVLLYIEDLQWVDASTLDLLQFLVSRISELKLLIIGEYRHETVKNKSTINTKPHPLTSFIRHNSSRANFSCLKLEPLSSTEVNEWVAKIFMKNKFPQVFLSRLYEETEGNPLFIREFLKCLVEQGVLFQDKNYTWRVYEKIDNIPLPSTIEQVIATRLDALSLEERRELELASIIGRDFALKLLDAISDSDFDTLCDYIENYLDTRLITELEERDEYFRFSHGKIREYTYQAIRRFRRRQLHTRLAEAMEILFSGNLMSVSAIIGNHFAEGGNHRKAYEYFLQAGTENLRLYANREAQINFNQALECYHEIPSQERNSESKIIALEGLSQATRDLNEFSRAIGYYTKTLSAAKEIKREKVCLRSCSQLGTLYSILGNHERARIYCDEGLVIAERVGNENEVLRLMNDSTDISYRVYVSRMVESLCVRNLDEEKVLNSTASHAMTFLHGISDAEISSTETVRAMKNKGLTLFVSHNYKQALEVYQDAIAIIEAKDNIKSGYVYVMLGDVYRALQLDEEALDAYKKYAKWAFDIDAKHAQMKAHQVLGQYEFEKGNFEEAMVLYKKGMALYDEVQAAYPYSQILACIGLLKEKTGNIVKANEYYRKAVKAAIGPEWEGNKSAVLLKLALLEISWHDSRMAKYHLYQYLRFKPECKHKEEIKTLLYKL
jgi:tetratricopeptide (TPR) repeat protein